MQYVPGVWGCAFFLFDLVGDLSPSWHAHLYAADSVTLSYVCDLLFVAWVAARGGRVQSLRVLSGLRFSWITAAVLDPARAASNSCVSASEGVGQQHNG